MKKFVVFPGDIGLSCAFGPAHANRAIVASNLGACRDLGHEARDTPCEMPYSVQCAHSMLDNVMAIMAIAIAEKFLRASRRRWNHCICFQPHQAI